MGLEADVRAAADDITDARNVIVADSGTLHAIAHGPATGTGSLVATESGNVRTAARAIEELGSGSSYLLKSFANAEGILGEAHGGTGGTDFGAAVADAMSTSFQVLARTYNQGNDAEARDDLGVGVVVKSATQAAPPTSPATGDTYLVPAGATGAWAGQAGKRARWASPTAGQWNFRTPTRGWSVWADDTNTLWEYDSAGWSASLAGGSAPAVYSPLDGRIAGIGKTNGHGGGAKFTVRWTADGRILVCGATSVLGIDSAGANWGQYTVNWPRTANGTIQAIYVGFDYFLIRTNKATGNLFFCGVAGNAQGGQSNTTTQATPVAIAYFASMTVVDVVTEATHHTSGWGTQARFWFARTSDGRLHGCGAGANNTMGVSITTDRGLPQVIADGGGTPLENIAGVACFSVYAPVYAWTTDGKCWVWGAGTSGAHGQGSTANLTSPVLLGGSANPWTGITKAAVTGSSISDTFAVAAIIQNGKVKVAGSQYYGIGNGAALSSGALTAFADATGAIAAETAVDIVAGGGEHATLGARTAAGSAWLCGYQATNANLGDNTVTNRNVFQKATLPSGLDGNVTKIRFGGGNTYNFTVIEANVGGTLQLCAAGYGANGQLGYGIFSPYNGSFSGVANALYAITDWAIVGDYAASALHVLTDDGRDRACGANDVGQLGTQPGNLHNVPILQPCTNETRLLKGPTPHADTSWSSTTTYSFNDLVPYQGSVWRCRVTTSLDVAPPSLPTTLNSDWQCWSQKGDTGAAGANGTNGTNGINGANGADGEQGPIGPMGAAGAGLSNPWDGRRWAALGTSITAQGYYTTPLAALLGATLTNLGASGGSLSSSSGYGPQAIYDKIALIASNAELVTFEVGFNDFRGNATLGALGDATLATFYGALHKAITDTITGHTGRAVVMFTPYGATDTGPNWNTPNANGNTLQQFQQAVRDVARKFGVPVLDVGTEAGIGGLTASVYLSDQIHLNTAGGNQFAVYCYSRLLLLAPAAGAQVATPTFSPAAGNYETAQSVTIACATPGASIYYTTNGATPTMGSTLYAGAISVAAATTIRAIAVKPGLLPSFVGSASYTIGPTSEVGPGTGTWTLHTATLGELSGTNLTVNSLTGGTDGGVAYTRTGGGTWNALWLASGSNNAVEFVIAANGGANAHWLLFGDGASGWYGIGDFTSGNVNSNLKFSSAGAIIGAASGGFTNFTTTAFAPGDKIRACRRGTAIEIYRWNGTSWDTVRTFDTASIAGIGGYIETIKVGILLTASGFNTVKSVRVGTCV